MTWNPQIAANRYYKRIVSGTFKRTNINPSKYKAYLTTEQLKEIKKVVEKNKLLCSKVPCRSDFGKKRTAKASNEPEPEFDKTKYTIKYLQYLLRNNPNDKITQSTKEKHAKIISSLLKFFEVTTLVELFEKYSKEEILQRLTDKYASALNIIGVINILIQDITPEVGKHVGKDIIDFFKFSKAPLKASETLRNKERIAQDDTDYKKIYDDIVKREEQLRKTKYATMVHLFNVLHLKGIFDNQGKLKMIPRGYYKKVQIIDDDAKSNDTENFYNKKTGKIIINDLKTKNHFRFKYIFDKDVKKLIDVSLDRLPRDYLITNNQGELLTDTGYSNLHKSALTIGNRDYRKIMETKVVYDFDVSRVDASLASAHTIDSQENSYLLKQQLPKKKQKKT